MDHHHRGGGGCGGSVEDEAMNQLGLQMITSSAHTAVLLGLSKYVVSPKLHAVIESNPAVGRVLKQLHPPACTMAICSWGCECSGKSVLGSNSQ